MLTSIKNILTGSPSPFALQSYPGFPYSDWLAMQTRYAEFRLWYSGDALREVITDSKTGKQTEKYPLKINPIKGTCEKHTSVLLGNTLESIRDGGIPVTFVPDDDKEESSSKKSSEKKDPSSKDTSTGESSSSKVIKEAITKTLMSSGGGSLFVSNGIISQYMGGCVWAVGYKPWNEEYPVQAMNPKPEEFLAYPEGTNFWDLREVWFVREISWVDAKAYGYPVPEIVAQSEMPSDPATSGYKYYYIEHWTKEEYKISVNELTIRKGVDKVALEGKNPFGIVPFVYIPHIREGNFLGESLITEAVKGIVREMNLREADIGDAVSDDAHTVLATRGVKGALKSAKLPDGRAVVDLGSAAGLGGHETQPDLIAVRTQSASEPQLKFVERLDTRYRVEVKHPAVADGIDEGSQRSSLTLTTRMWPMQAHVELERINWTVGLMALAKIILKMCAVQGVYGVTEEHTKIGMIIKWATMLPRDREALVNEVAIRKKNKLISQKHGIELFGDVDNVEEEIKLIDEEAEADAEREAKLNPKPFGKEGAGGEMDGEKTSKQPAAQNSLKKEE